MVTEVGVTMRKCVSFPKNLHLKKFKDILFKRNDEE